MQRFRWSWTQAAATSCAALLCICCDGATPLPRTPGRVLPPYAGHSAELFDDSIEPTAVGYGGAYRETAPRNDTLLRERTRSGDAVVRARVVTVTSSPEDDGHSWQIGLRPLETLAGSRPPQGDFTLRVEGQGPAAGIVRALEARLVGATFVVFVREFEAGRTDGQDVDSQLHFHLGKDDDDEQGAVRQATLLGDVR